MTMLSELKARNKPLMFDLFEEAGFDSGTGVSCLI